MQFIFTLLHKVAAGIVAYQAAKGAYAETLSKHHTFIVEKTFDMGLMAAPSTDTMLPCLGSDKVFRQPPRKDSTCTMLHPAPGSPPRAAKRPDAAPRPVLCPAQSQLKPRPSKHARGSGSPHG